jgi:hypothetical protein
MEITSPHDLRKSCQANVGCLHSKIGRASLVVVHAASVASLDHSVTDRLLQATASLVVGLRASLAVVHRVARRYRLGKSSATRPFSLGYPPPPVVTPCCDPLL